jgi:ribosomal-protein-alanine N-acetyltransferase
VIETERLLLRKPVLEDARPALDLTTDPVAMEFLGGVHPNAATDPEFVVHRWLERWDGNGCGPFSVVRREDGRWLGRTGILVWDVRTWTHTTFAEAGEFAQPELGWALASEHWGQGYATEAALAVREWAYAEHAFPRLVSLIAPVNVRSQRLAQRLGATPGETVELFDNGPHVVWEHPRPVPRTVTKGSQPRP